MPQKPDKSTLFIRVNPRSSQNKIRLEPDDTLKVWVTAPPVEGEANKAVCEIVASHLGVAKGRVSVASGESGRNKKLLIEGLPLSKVIELLRGSPST